MEKPSIYNINIEYNKGIILYNTLTNCMLYITKDEFQIIEKLMHNLKTFHRDYPQLYDGFRDSGFIVKVDFDELEYIKFQNRKRVFEDTLYHITINPTLDCNLTCWYCSTEFAKAQHNGRMSNKMVENVINHIEKVVEEKRARALHLDWFGGEPLMYFKEVIYPIARYGKDISKKNNIPFSQHITTNATLIDEEVIIAMKDLGFTSFQIPIDGNEKRHNKIKFFNKSKKYGTYSLIMNNINLLTKIIPEAQIVLRINFDKQTLKNVSDIIKDIEENAKKNIEIDFQKVWQVSFDDKTRELLNEVKEIFYANNLMSGFWAYRPQMFYRCYADRLHHYAINYDGRIFKCTARDYGDDKSIGKLLFGGDVEWNQELLSAYFSSATFENEQCISCNKLPLCMGPCIQKNYDWRKGENILSCNFEDAGYSLSSYIIEQAKKREIIPS